MLEVTAELPMLALIFTRKLRPIAIGSISGWLMLAGMMARPARDLVAHELGRDQLGNLRAHGVAAQALRASRCRARYSAIHSRLPFSRIATNSISGVTMPRRA